MPRAAAVVRGEPKPAPPPTKQAIERVGGSVDVLGGEDRTQQQGGGAQVGDVGRGELDRIGLAVFAQEFGEGGGGWVGRRVVRRQHVDQGDGASGHGLYRVAGGPLVVRVQHSSNVTHLANN